MARKPIYDTADKLSGAIRAYMDRCRANGADPLYADMLLSLGISRDTWDAYRNPTPTKTDTPDQIIDRLRMSVVVKNAELELTRVAEDGLLHGDPKRTTAYIFLLKQRAYGGYSDQQIAQLSGGITVKIDGCGEDAGR
jgi:hypothetical protein